MFGGVCQVGIWNNWSGDMACGRVNAFEASMIVLYSLLAIAGVVLILKFSVLGFLFRRRGVLV